MTPPREAWRAWFYACAWMGGGMFACGLTIWLVRLIRWDWPADRAAQQLTILGNALYGALAIVALVILGLTMRNAIKHIKGTALGGSIEARGGSEP